MEVTQKIKRFDYLGIAASSLCAIHCTITPLFIAAKPLLESSISTKDGCSGIWAGFDYFFLLLSFVAVWYSSRHTKHRTIKWILWIGWTLFACGILLEIASVSIAPWLMYSGSILLVITHVWNISYCAACNHEECS